MQLDVPVHPKTEEPKSAGLCEAEEKLKLGFCQIFLENEISLNFNFVKRTGNFVCERRKIVLTTLNQSNLNNNHHMDTYQCPQIVESALLPEIHTYHVSQAHPESPVIVYTQRNSFSQIHPFKAVLHIDFAALANTNVQYYNEPGSLLVPMDSLSWNVNVNELVEEANQSIEAKKLTQRK